MPYGCIPQVRCCTTAAWLQSGTVVFHFSFVDLGDEHRAEVDRPNAVVGFFEAEVVLLQGAGDEEELVLETKGPSVGDALYQEVGGVLRGGKRSG